LRGDQHRRRVGHLQPPPILRVDEIHLVVYVHQRNIGRADLLQHAMYGSHLPITFRARRVDDMQREIRLCHFLERGAKRRDQRVWKPVDESNGVRDEQMAAVRQPHLANKRIERHKQRVRYRSRRFGEAVEQRRLARIRVTDECHRRHGLFLTTFAQLQTALSHLIDFALNRLNAYADTAPIRFEFRFSGTTRSDAAAKTRQRDAGAHQPRKQVFELRKLDLPLPFSRSGAPRENVKDQLRSIEDLALEPLFELAKLRRCQLVVENDNVNVCLGARRCQSGDFTAAEKGSGIRLRSLLKHSQHDCGAGGIGETRQFVERVFRFDTTRTTHYETHQGGAFSSGKRGGTAIGHYAGLRNFNVQFCALLMTHFLQLLLLLALIVSLAKLSGALANRFGQPAVFGEILIGLLLGPTLFDVLGWPAFATSVAVAAAEPALDLLSLLRDLAAIGVLLLMFVAGLETDLKEMRHVGRVAFWAAFGGVALPLAGGAATAVFFGLPLFWEGLFVGTILTATSVSISAQTLIEIGALRTREGSAILGAAVIDDVMGIIALSIMVALARASSSNVDVGQIALVFARIIVFFVVAIYVGQWLEPFLRWSARLEVSQGLLASVLVVAFVYAWAAEYLGSVAAITGSYLAGVLIGRTPFKRRVDMGIHPLTYSMFVPIFFVSIGLQANGRDLGAHAGFTVLLVIVAIVAKAVGCAVFARLFGFTAKQAIRVGAGMISRGEVGLIVAGYGLDHGLIGRDVFSASVIMVLATTMVTPPLLRLTFPRRRGKEVTVEETIGGPPEEAEDAS
jgi:Na+:H+ antiporter